MALFDNSAANALLKEWYDGQVPENLVYRTGPLFALMEKGSAMVQAGGKNFPVPLIIGAGNSSGTFSDAQTYQNPVNAKSFFPTAMEAFSLATIDDLTAASMASDKGAFMRGLKVVSEGAFQSIGLKMSRDVYRRKAGDLCTFTSQSGAGTNASPLVLTLDNKPNTVMFEVGNIVQAGTLSGLPAVATLRSGIGKITARSTQNGTISVVDVNNVGLTWTNNDSIFMKGDSNNNISGLRDWLPSFDDGDPVSGDSFFSVDRSPDPERLAGLRFDGSSMTIREALLKAANTLVREGGKPNYAFLNPDSWSALQLSLLTQVRPYLPLKVGQLQFPAIELSTEGGMIQIVADRNCPPKQCYLLTMDSWKMYSVGGDIPRVLTYDDGNYFLRVYNQNAQEARIGGYPQIGCTAPGWNATIKLAQ